MRSEEQYLVDIIEAAEAIVHLVQEGFLTFREVSEFLLLFNLNNQHL
jgi:hypothetical protein